MIVVCPDCGEVLGETVDDGGYSAQWWADKELFEHQDERHS